MKRRLVSLEEANIPTYDLFAKAYRISFSELVRRALDSYVEPKIERVPCLDFCHVHKADGETMLPIAGEPHAHTHPEPGSDDTDPTYTGEMHQMVVHLHVRKKEVSLWDGR